MPSINIRERESLDIALRRFKRACEKAGIPSKLRQLESYEKPTTKRKRKHASAIKRWQKRLQKEQEYLMRLRVRRSPAEAIEILKAHTQVTTATSTESTKNA